MTSLRHLAAASLLCFSASLAAQTYAAQHPSADQYVSDVPFLVATGDVQARANTLFSAAQAAGHSLTIHIVGPEVSPSSTSLVVPCSSNMEFSIVGENGAVLKYNGSGPAIQICNTGESAVNSFDRLEHFGLEIGSSATAGVTTASGGATYGFEMNGVNIHGAAYSEVACLVAAGNVVKGNVTNSSFDFCTNGVRLTKSSGSFTSGPNSWTFTRNSFSNNGDWGLSVDSDATPQNLSVIQNTFEGNGCRYTSGGKTPRVGLFGLIQLQSFQGAEVSSNYLEGDASCGSQLISIGSTVSNVVTDGLHIHDNLSNASGAQSDISLVSGNRIGIERPGASGAETCVVTVGANVSGDYLTLENIPGPVCFLPGAQQPKIIVNPFEVTFSSSDLRVYPPFLGKPTVESTQTLDIPNGSCVVLSRTPLQLPYFKVEFDGSFENIDTATSISKTNPVVLTSSANSIAVGNGSLSVILDPSTNQVCAKATGAHLGHAGRYLLTALDSPPTS